MPTTNSIQAAERAAGKKLDGAINGGANRRFRFDVPLTAQAVGDIANLGKKPRGFRFSFGNLIGSVGLGATTVAIGTAADPAKYRAAAVMNTADVPQPFGKQTAVAAAEGDEEDLVLTFGAAAAPGAGVLTVDFFASERG